jgi:hypothetical protein
MDLSRIAIEPRLRENWEAVDMGIAMVRAWWWPLQLCWLLPSASLFIVLLFVFSETTWLAFVITWWLNPLWDRFPLLLASRALFDEPLSVKKVWSEWWQVLKIDWFAWLTWRRLSPTRGLDMPITVLEQLHGPVRGRRLDVLHRNTAGVAFFCTILCLLFELLTVGAIWVLVLMLIPSEFWVEELFSGFNQLFWLSKWSVIIWYLALAMVAPFYVVTGFALYINRRIELEGWDIEIRFRHLAQRYEAAKPNSLSAKKIAALILPVLLGLGALGQTPHSFAQENDNTGQEVVSEAAGEAKRNILEVLSGDDYSRTEVVEGWRFKKKTDEESGYWWLEAAADFVDFIAPAVKFLVQVFKVVPILVWVMLGLLIAFALYYFRDALTSIGRGRQKPSITASPDVMFGLDLRKESLPDNVPAEVSQLWRDGKHREAISLLYRATLSSLIHQFSFEFYDGYTEQECATIVQANNTGKLSTYVQRLTSVWQSIAYAHRLPSDGQITELCSEWPSHFDEASRRER